MSRISPTRFGLLAFALIAQAFLSAGAIAQTRVYAVWWSPLLNLSNLGAVEDELTKPFEQAVTLTKDDRAAVGDCLDLTRRVEQGYRPNDVGDAAPFSTLTAHCYALAALKEAKPARASFLRDFAMTSGAMDVLPAMVGVEWCFDQLGKVLAANRDGLTWSQFAEADTVWTQPSEYRVVAADPTSIVVERIVLPYGSDVRHERRVSVFGRGDFNGDAVDDLLLRTDWRDGGEVGSALYVVSKLDEDTPFRVVATWGPQPNRLTGCD